MDTADKREIVIEADRVEQDYWRDVWSYRELFYFLAWRNIVVRYKQTAIGVGWALIRPAISVIVFTVVFGRLARLSSETSTPYPLLVAAGTLPWQFFASGFTDAAASLTNNPALISKVYFPRVILPTSACITNLLDLAVGLACTVALMLFYGALPPARIVLLPCFGLLCVISAVGLGLWLAALNARFQDVRVLVPFMAQVGLYFSPVGFQSGLIPERFRALYAINPMVGIIDGFRWSLIRDCPAPSSATLLVSVLASVLLLVSGVMFFRRMERTFADIL